MHFPISRGTQSALESKEENRIHGQGSAPQRSTGSIVMVGWKGGGFSRMILGAKRRYTAPMAPGAEWLEEKL
jgi:hypothetical protein